MLRISLDKENKNIAQNPTPDPALDFLEPQTATGGRGLEDDPEIGVSDNGLETAGDVLYNYSSIYDIFVHIRQLADPEDSDVVKIVSKHPERLFPTLTSVTGSMGSGGSRPSIAPSLNNFTGDVTIADRRQSSFLSVGSNEPVLPSRRRSSFALSPPKK